MQRRGLLSCTLSLTSHVFTLFMGAGVPLHMSQHILNVRLCPHSAAVPSKCVQRATLSPQRLGGGAFKQPPRGKWRHAEKTSRPSASTEDSCAFLCIIPLCAECIWAVKNVLMNQSYCRCRVQAGCAEISQREDIKARLVWFQLHREFLLRLIIVPV